MERRGIGDPRQCEAVPERSEAISPLPEVLNLIVSTLTLNPKPEALNSEPLIPPNRPCCCQVALSTPWTPPLTYYGMLEPLHRFDSRFAETSSEWMIRLSQAFKKPDRARICPGGFIGAVMPTSIGDGTCA